MIIPDINLLLYAFDTASPQHAKAAKWWTGCLNGDEPVGLFLPVILGFTRIGTHTLPFSTPMTIGEAETHVRSWLAQPHVNILHPANDHLDRVFALLHQAGAAGRLVSDAELAAIAIEHHAVLHTTDADFLKFPGLRWHNPITGKSGTNPVMLK